MLRGMIKLKSEEGAMGRSRGVCCAVAFGVVSLLLSAGTGDALECPDLIGEWGVPGVSANSVAVSGGYVYLSTTDDADIGGLTIIDETNLVEVGSLSLGGECSGNSLVVSGQYAYVNCWSNEPLYAQVIDVSDPTQPNPVGTFSGLGRVDAVRHGLAYTLTEDRVRVVDVTNPAHAVELGSVVVDLEYRLLSSRLDVSGDHLYVTGLRWVPPSNYYSIENLWAIDVSEPSAPLPVGSVSVGPEPPFVSFSVSFELTGNYAFVNPKIGNLGLPTGYIKIVDIHDPTDMFVAVTDVAGANNFATNGSILFTMVYGWGDPPWLIVYDVRDPLAVSLAGEIPAWFGSSFFLGAHSVMSGAHCYVVDGGLRVYDTSICTAEWLFQDGFESGDLLAWSGEHAISWWPAEGNANDAIGTNHGMLHGEAGFTNGAVGQAFSFDGVDDYVSIPHDPSLDSGTEDFSVAFWIRTQSTEGTVVFKKGDNSYPYSYWDIGFSVYLVNGQPELSMGGPYNLATFTAPTAIADDSFHHVAYAVDRDGDSGTCAYIDGVLVQTFDPSIRGLGPINNSEELLIGWDGSGGSFEGAVDEVMLFRRAITADEVAALAGVR